MQPPAAQATSAFEAATYSKITWRLMPYLFLCYILAYVDRVNVGFAKLQMQQDLSMSDAVYGAGAGIFFIGYFFFEVPANMMMRRLGARRWLGPIMMAWGIVSTCTMFVQGAFSFYVLRFILGIVECGFFPGVILYLTYWYTDRRRAKMVAAFMSAIPLAGVFAGPISGGILGTMAGVSGLRAWQWLFLVEGIPSFLAGIVTLWFLPDNPTKASWLSQDERALIEQQLQQEDHAKRLAGGGSHRLADAFRSGKVWLMCLIYFGITAGNYGLGFWLPQVLKETVTPDPVKIGWISAIPWGAAATAMILAGRHSDKTGERRWHIALSTFLGAIAFVASAIPGIPGTVGVATLALAAMGILSANAMFWAMPTALLSGAAAAAGIAWINSVGNLAGYASPWMVGLVRDKTHSMVPALLVLACAALGSGVITLYVAKKK